MSDEIEVEYKVPHTLTDIVKAGNAEFAYYKEDTLFYTVDAGEYRYEFPIDLTNKADIGEASFERTYKAITLMRYIRKAIADKKLRWSRI